MTIDRRTLIRRSCMTASLATLPRWAAAGIFRGPRETAASLVSDTVLVVLDMNGGNDGLNTIVPHADPVYRSARVRIGLTGTQLLPITGEPGLGLHPSLSHLHGYLESGKLAIVRNVGYPQADMSHFVSDDIWEKAVLEPETESTGWLGRALDRIYGSDPDKIHAISASGDVPALRSNLVTAPVITDAPSFDYPRTLEASALTGLLQPTGQANRDYVAHIGEIALADADAVQAAASAYSSTIVYPEESSLAAGLRLTASMLFADLGPRIFFVGQGGYDTHDSQLGTHDELLTELDQSLDAFYRDLVEHGQDQRVIVMTYSEFGRRVDDNASGGTDHGTAGPLFVLGSRVKGGLFGDPPSLTDLDGDGNLKFSTDFRQVYASVLANWIDTDPKPILGNVEYPTVPFL